MADFEQKIKEVFAALKSERLTERERFVMRSELELLMKKHPVRPPFYVQLMDHWRAPGALGQTFIGRHVMATAFALVLVMGVGSTYAAEGALPGDTLYPLKVHINEQVIGAIALSDEAKIDWSASIAERRLEEAEALAADGSLTLEKSAKIAAYLDTATKNFDDRIAKLAKAENKTELIDDAEKLHEISLAAHANVLENMSQKMPHASEALQPIVESVRGKIDARRSSAAAIAIARPTSTPQVMSDRALEKAKASKERAQKKVEEIKSLAEKSRTTLGTSTYRIVHDEASSTIYVIQAADSAIERGEYDAAIQTYTNAIQFATEAKAGLNAQIRIEQSIRSSGGSKTSIKLFDGDDDDREDHDD